MPPTHRRLRGPAILLTLVVLAACSGSNPAPDSTSGAASSVPSGTDVDATDASTADAGPGTPSSADALYAAIDDAGAFGFECRIGTTLIASDLYGRGRLYRSMDDAGNGLEIFTDTDPETMATVSYARYVGPLDPDASAARQDIVRRLDGAWATWGQPDTITLEELPATASTCLTWISDASNPIDTVIRHDDGSFEFHMASPMPGDSVGGAGTLRPDASADLSLLTVTDSSGETVISIRAGNDAICDMRCGPNNEGSALELARSSVRKNHVEITQAEYFALVGG